jgi:antitoxin (DNA-binding transcriptional repressor) of toxin-antitoxin stability system
METTTVGIREFRENLSTYLLEAEAPVAITRHGDTVGFYLPVRRKRTSVEKAAFEEVTSAWQKMLDEKEISEEEILVDFKNWRKQQRQ